MEKPVVALEQTPRPAEVDTELVLNALATAVVVVDPDGAVVHLNSAAEQFFRGSAQRLRGQRLGNLLPADSPLFALVDQVRSDGNAVSEYGVPLDSPRIGRHFVNIQATPVA